MKSDAPIAVISGTSRGALRSGRYAIRSSSTAVATRDDDRDDEEDRRAPGPVAVQEPALRVCVGEEVRAERAGHEHLAVREVDHPQDPVHEAVAQRDHREDGALRDALDR